MSMATLTEEDQAMLRAQVHKLKPMCKELFLQKLKLIDENYPLTLPNWLQLTLQIGSRVTLLTAGGALLWFGIKHISHLTTLWKFSNTLVTKLRDNPNLFPHLLSVGTEFLNRQCPPSPPPCPGPSGHRQCTEVSATKLCSSTTYATKGPGPVPHQKPLTPTTPHHNTLEFITQVAQELYSRGKLRAKPYLEHLKRELEGGCH